MRLDDYCAEHASQSTDIRKQLAREDSKVTQLIKEADREHEEVPEEIVRVADELQMISLRERMHERAETLSTEFSGDLISEAVSKLEWFQNRPDDIEVAQLYHQFKRLDINKDGFIDLDDIINLIKFIDPDLVKSYPDRAAEMGTKWLREESVDSLPSEGLEGLRWTFANYVKVVMAKREKDKQL